MHIRQGRQRFHAGVPVDKPSLRDRRLGAVIDDDREFLMAPREVAKRCQMPRKHKGVEDQIMFDHRSDTDIERGIIDPPVISPIFPIRASWT